MDLTPTDEHEALRAAARDFLARRGSDRDPWSTIAQLGWLGVSVPEQDGGVGMGLLEEAIIAEESAASLLPAPWFSTVALALPALQACEDRALVARVAAGELRATLAWAEPDAAAALSSAGVTPLATRAVGGDADGAWAVTGRKTWVPDAAQADLIVVLAATDTGSALLAVPGDASGLAVRPVPTYDDTRPLAELTLDETPAVPLIPAARTPEVLAAIGLRASTLAAAEAVGVARRTLDLAVEYASVREQFGRVIGTYQGVSHKLANRFLALELSRSLVLWAALAVDAGNGDARVAVAAAAAKALPEAVTTCEDVIQVFGAVGTTWESPLHRYYRRAIALAAFDGPADRHRATVARTLLGPVAA